MKTELPIQTELLQSAQIRNRNSRKKTSTTTTTRNHQQIWNYRWKIKPFYLFVFNHHFPFQLASSFVCVCISFALVQIIINTSARARTHYRTLQNKSIPFICVFCLFTLLWNYYYTILAKNMRMCVFFSVWAIIFGRWNGCEPENNFVFASFIFWL